MYIVGITILYIYIYIYIVYIYIYEHVYIYVYICMYILYRERDTYTNLIHRYYYTTLLWDLSSSLWLIFGQMYAWLISNRAYLYLGSFLIGLRAQF